MKVKVAKIVPNLDLVYLEPLNGYFPYLADIGRPKPGMKFTVGGFDNSGSFNKAYSTGQIYTAEDNWRNLNGEKKGPFWIATANTSLGDSGAPCINSDGLLIGMTVQLTNITERFQNIAIGAAVPLVADNLIIGADVMKYSGLELFDITIESKDFILDMSKW
uniref:Serine protease n=1 Tax=Panagrolaimus sp. JU765 TaxID=591449 RepID=A0AC34RHR5_9BILA